ncbi:MAG TPA: AAA family ATPase [Rhodanobacteraceae bacterium]|nr:AAA family ATPase [Rhodanobacteraceae bacterium]
MTALVLPAGLRDALAERDITHADMATACGVSRSAITQLLAHGCWPVRRRRAFAARLATYLAEHGIDTKKKAPRRSNAKGPFVPPTTKETPDMLLKKTTLSPAARKHFGLSRDPFTDCRELADVFLDSADVRYAREAMWSTVRHGGFLGVVGESGSGKTTLREELLERLQRDEPSVIAAQPYVLAMEERDTVGTTLRSKHIAECLLRAVAPLAPLKSSPEARFRQLHETLRESARSGMRHTLLIEEAHCLPIPTLKHLKRYLELKDGMRPLLSIVLLGQPELAVKLDESNPQVREVAQRIELLHLPPLDQHLGAYLRHRFARAGADYDAIMAADGLSALQTRLTPRHAPTRGSLLYPLAVHNALASAMNTAATLGAPKVTRDMFGGAA